MSKLSEEQFARLKRICRNGGLKLTHQRLEIFEELVRAEDHPSAEMIFKRVQSRTPTISLDTVYRTLATFERFGLISKTHVSDGRARYDADLSPHHHLVCSRCKAISDFHWQEFDSIEPPEEVRNWGVATSKVAVMSGICKHCLKKEEEESQRDN
ncbi:MAG: transcriptional repressor [Deltaproteobacteria bacterium]|nr:transcriptional repressor [Deltaproteobacteria bacterium]MBW2071092.1 transcriptional repressor [Deltaproteobacteria bacterium]